MVVVKLDVFPINFGAVARGAFLLAEQRFAVDVFVAGRSIGGPIAQAKHGFWVAAVARDADVFGFVRETGVGVVIELHRLDLSPIAGVVTAFAVGHLLVKFAVRGFMAGRASLCCQKKTGPTVRGLLLVTVLALDHRVALLQRKTGQRVVREFLLPTQRGPTEQIRIQTAVFFVAQHTRTTQRFGRGVKANFLRNPLADRLVAVQAFLFVNFAISRRVTLAAIVLSF